MTTISFNSSTNLTNDTTPVTVVTAPSVSQVKVVRNILVYNADSSPVTIRVALVRSASPYPVWEETIATLETANITTIINMLSTDTLEVVLGGAVAADQATVVVNWALIAP